MSFRAPSSEFVTTSIKHISSADCAAFTNFLMILSVPPKFPRSLNDEIYKNVKFLSIFMVWRLRATETSMVRHQYRSHPSDGLNKWIKNDTVFLPRASHHIIIREFFCVNDYILTFLSRLLAVRRGKIVAVHADRDLFSAHLYSTTITTPEEHL